MKGGGTLRAKRLTTRATGEAARLPRAVRALHVARACLAKTLADATLPLPLSRASALSLRDVDKVLDRLERARFTKRGAA